MDISKITLGTAQFGFNYGIANIYGKPKLKKSFEILKFARDNGVNTFDTAPSYGNSEEIIGNFFSSEDVKNKVKPIIITKLSPIKNRSNLSFNYLYSYIKEEIHKSLKSLKIKKIPIYLIHRAKDILLNNGVLVDCLNQAKNEEIIENFGVSVYNPEEIEDSLNFKEVNVIQIPVNIFDQRTIRLGLLKELKKKKYLIFARSIYLQGLFFMSPYKLPNYLKIAEKPLIKLRYLADYYKIDIANLALLFVRDLPEITSLIVGSEKLEQVVKNLEILEEEPLGNEIRERIYEEFNNMPNKLINPSLWNQ